MNLIYLIISFIKRFLVFAGLLSFNLQIHWSLPKCFNSNAWKSQSMAKAYALWISQVWISIIFLHAVVILHWFCILFSSNRLTPLRISRTCTMNFPKILVHHFQWQHRLDYFVIKVIVTITWLALQGHTVHVHFSVSLHQLKKWTKSSFYSANIII